MNLHHYQKVLDILKKIGLSDLDLYENQLVINVFVEVLNK